MKVVFKIFSLLMTIVFLFSFNSEKNNLFFNLNVRNIQRNLAMEKINSEISPSSNLYHHTDTIKIKVNGNLITTGDCSPAPAWGLLVKCSKEWKTLIDVKALPQLMCGMPTHDFSNETIDVCAIDLEKQNQWYYWRFFSQGEYKFTVLSADRERIIESSSFAIE